MGAFSQQIEKCVFTHTVEQAHWYECQVTDQWLIGTVSNGGIGLAIAAYATTQHPALKANGHTVPLSTSARYLRPIGVEKIDIEVTTIKLGKTISTMQANVYCSKKLALYVTLTMGVLSPENNLVVSVSNNPPIKLDQAVQPPSPQTILDVGGNYRKHVVSTINGTNQMALKSNVKPNDFHSSFTGTTGFIDEDITVLSLIALTDSMPPPIFNKVGAFGWVPTLELTVHIRALPIGKFSTAHYTANTKYLGNDLMDEDFQLFNPAGMLLAESRQLSKTLMPIPHLDTILNH